MSTSLKHIFVTSDHHFGSYKLPSFLKVFTEEQEKELVEKWNLTVGKDDIVYCNGDFCDGTVADLCRYAKQLNGKKTLILGNHDNLPIEVYKAVFNNVVDEVCLEELDGIKIHHCPKLDGTLEIYGHLHRDSSFSQKKPHGFCTCASLNNGFPVSLEKVMMSLR